MEGRCNDLLYLGSGRSKKLRILNQLKPYFLDYWTQVFAWFQMIAGLCGLLWSTTSGIISYEELQISDRSIQENSDLSELKSWIFWGILIGSVWMAQGFILLQGVQQKNPTKLRIYTASSAVVAVAGGIACLIILKDSFADGLIWRDLDV